ncbi:MAG: hypothetical protein ACJ78Q_16660 [Chloroflexia bacterium]
MPEIPPVEVITEGSPVETAPGADESPPDGVPGPFVSVGRGLGAFTTSVAAPLPTMGVAVAFPALLAPLVSQAVANTTKINKSKNANTGDFLCEKLKPDLLLSWDVLTRTNYNSREHGPCWTVGQL